MNRYFSWGVATYQVYGPSMRMNIAIGYALKQPPCGNGTWGSCVEQVCSASDEYG